MPRASRKQIRQDVDLELKDHFAFLISTLSSSKEIEQFFTDFLTKEEKIMLAKRLMLHLMLENNYTSAQIESVIGVSQETVRVHKTIWRNGGQIYKQIIQKIAKRNKTKQFWDTVEKVLTPIELFVKSKRSMKSRAKLISGDWS